MSGVKVEIYEPLHFVILTAQANINIVTSYEPEVSSVTMDLATKTLLYKEMTIAYIIRNAPTARIILYEPKIKVSGDQKLYLALDGEPSLDPSLVHKIADDLHHSDVPLPCDIVDWQTLSAHEKKSISDNCIVWRK